MFSVFPVIDEDAGESGLNIHGVHILDEEKTNNPALNCSFYTFGRYSDGFCTFLVPAGWKVLTICTEGSVVSCPFGGRRRSRT